MNFTSVNCGQSAQVIPFPIENTRASLERNESDPVPAFYIGDKVALDSGHKGTVSDGRVMQFNDGREPKWSYLVICTDGIMRPAFGERMTKIAA